MNLRSGVPGTLFKSMTIATALLAAGVADAKLCNVDPVPAATLLIPYFEVDANCAVAGRNTTFTVANADAAPVLSRVQVWSNVGIPVFGFDVYLNGYDEQDIDLHAVLCDGWLPSTGSAVGSVGRFAQSAQVFTGCNATATPPASPVYGGNGAIGGSVRANHRAALSGQSLPASPGQCKSVANARGSMDGYITIDTVRQCGAPAFGQVGFSAALTSRNVLIGSAVLLDEVNNASVAITAVALESNAGALNASDSFYAADNVQDNFRREPLPSGWSVEAGRNGLSGSDLIVWRAPSKPSATAFTCATGFSRPLLIDNDSGYGSRGVFHVTDAGQAVPTVRTEPLKLSAQRVSATDEFPELAQVGSGWTYLNLHRQVVSETIPAQAWVGLVRGSDGRYQTLVPGAPADAGCNVSELYNVTTGLKQSYAGDAMLPNRHVTLSADGSSFTEGEMMTVTVSIGEPAEDGVDVSLIVDGGAGSRVDNPNPVGTILTGQTSVDLQVQFTDNGFQDGTADGTIRLEYISPAGNVTLGAPRFLPVEVLDND